MERPKGRNELSILWQVEKEHKSSQASAEVTCGLREEIMPHRRAWSLGHGEELGLQY